jgi:hypothetical protein
MNHFFEFGFLCLRIHWSESAQQQSPQIQEHTMSRPFFCCKSEMMEADTRAFSVAEPTVVSFAICVDDLESEKQNTSRGRAKQYTSSSFSLSISFARVLYAYS